MSAGAHSLKNRLSTSRRGQMYLVSMPTCEVVQPRTAVSPNVYLYRDFCEKCSSRPGSPARNSRLQMPHVQFSVDVRPKFLECIGGQPPGKSKAGTLDGCCVCGLARLAPGVRKEIVSGDSDISGVSGGQMPVGAIRQKRHFHYISNAAPERLIGRAKITRVFAPDGAQASFHRVTGGNTRQAHSVTAAESRPSRPIFLWAVECRPNSRRKKSRGQPRWTNGVSNEPA